LTEILSQIFLALFGITGMAMVVVAVVCLKTRKANNPFPNRDTHPLKEKFPEHFRSPNPSEQSIKQVLIQKIQNNEVEFEIASSRGKGAIEIDGIKFKHIKSKTLQTPEETEEDILKDLDLPPLPDEDKLPTNSTPHAPTKIEEKKHGEE